jgi:excisionase family DNA binding protein
MNNPVRKLLLKLHLVKRDTGNQHPSEKLFYSLAEVADTLHTSGRHLYNQIKQNKIRAIQISKGGNYRIPREEVERIRNKN